jgi:transposase
VAVIFKRHSFKAEGGAATMPYDQFIGCDAHKRYSVFVGLDEKGRASTPKRVEHTREAYRSHLQSLPAGSSIAVEASSGWYWLIEEMERAGHQPILAQARRAKLMMGLVNKTDRLDARGLAVLLRNGTLPAVWIPPAHLRDERELLRMRLHFARTRTALKNRIHATLARHGILISEQVSDLFGAQGRRLLASHLEQLPMQTRQCVRQELAILDDVIGQIEVAEERLKELVQPTPAIQLLCTMPCVGLILSATILLEIGDIRRFPTAAHLASYSGLVPRVHSSGGHTRMTGVSREINTYLKWAFVEAANLVCCQQHRLGAIHVVMLYRRLKKAKNHQKAVVAVGRHLAEAAFHILRRQVPYRAPQATTPTTAVRFSSPELG